MKKAFCTAKLAARPFFERRIKNKKTGNAEKSEGLFFLLPARGLVRQRPGKSPV